MKGTARASFRAMGTGVELLGPGGDAFDVARTAVVRRFTEDERRFSRFRGDSELSSVNRSAGTWTVISEELETVLRAAIEAATRSGGRFDPTVLGALEAAGYDRDYDEVLAGARAALHPAEPCGRWRDIELAPGRVRLPEGVGIDLGGLAKGWTVDAAAWAAVGAGLRWAMVNAGGDLRIVGDAPPLPVSIEDPDAPGTSILIVELATGALATSSVATRAWGPNAHHLIDPRTGRPAATDVVQATTWAPTCAEAEIVAKDLVLRGSDAAGATEAVVVTRGGDVLVSFRRWRGSVPPARIGGVHVDDVALATGRGSR